MAQVAQWANTAGSFDQDYGRRLGVDRNGNVYVSGMFESPTIDVDPGPGVYTLTNRGRKDGYVAKFDASGNLKWAFVIGGPERDDPEDLVVDKDGNVIVSGYYRETVDFDPGPGVFNLTSNGYNGQDNGFGGDAFVAKYDSSGNFKWAFGVGGSTIIDDAVGVGVDANNNVLVSGFFEGQVDFDPSSTGTTILNSATRGRFFVAKYTPNGQFVWAANAGQASADASGYDVSADNAGNVFVTGFFQGTNINFDPSPTGSVLVSSVGGLDMFVAKYSPSGALLWVRTGGGATSTEAARGLMVDPNGDVYCVGDFASSSISFTGAPQAFINQGGNDMFLVKYAGNGDYQWTVTLSGPGTELGYAISRDTVNNIMVAGGFSSASVDFDPSANTALLSSAGGYDVYVAKYSPAGKYLCAFRMGGTGDDIGYAIGSYDGNLQCLAGYFTSTSMDFDPGPATLLRSSQGGYDAFLEKFAWSATLPAGNLTLASAQCNQAKLVFNATAGTPPYTLYISNGSTTSVYSGVKSSIPFLITPQPSIATTYTLTAITDSSACPAVALVNQPINVPGGIGLTTTGNKTICAQDSVQLSASGGIQFNWSPSAGLSNVAIPNPKASPLATTTYKVVASDGGACKDSAYVTVTVNAKPVLSASTVAPSCAGDSVQLNVTGAANYLWSPAAGLSSPSIANPKAAPSGNTTYQVTGTSAAGCTATASVTVTVLPKPSVTVTPATASFCPGASVPLSATGGGSYQWSPAAGLSNAAIATPVATPAASTNYKVVVTGANGCRDSATVALTKYTVAPVTATTSGAFCPGDSAQLNANGGVGYSWTPAAGLSAINVANPKAAPNASTNYTVKVTDANGCASNVSVQVNRLTKPTAVATVSGAICPSDSAQLIASGGAFYQWAPATGLSNAAISAPLASPAGTTSYSVYVTNADGCKDTTQVTVTVKNKPVIGVSPAVATICARDSVQLRATGGVGYSWSPAAGLSNAGVPDPKAAPAASTTYQVVVTGANGCRDSARSSITVNPLPSITVTPSSNLCRGDSLQLNASGGSTYQWRPAAGLSNVSIAAPKAGPATTTTYVVVATTAQGCVDSLPTTVTVNAKPVIAITPATRLCRGDSLQLSATGGTQYQWRPASSLVNANTANPTAFPRDTTRYTVVVTNAAGCVDSANTQVNVFRLPLVFRNRDTILCSGATYTADASLLPGSTSWLWSDGSTQPAFTINGPGNYWVQTTVTGCYNPIRDSIRVDTLGRPTVSLGADRDICSYDVFFLVARGNNISQYLWSDGSSNDSLLVTGTGNYWVRAGNRCGVASDTAFIFVDVCNDELYFPTAFTPNGDGRNDLFRAAHLPGVTVLSYDLEIYNRWGELVFRTNKLDAGWDGIFRGKRQDTGSFVWQVRYRRNAGVPEQFRKGSFVLIR